MIKVAELVVLDGKTQYGTDGCDHVMFVPILTSSTEKIEKGDKVLCDDRIHKSSSPLYSIQTVSEIEDGWIFTIESPGEGYNPDWTFKTLALPEHFSPETLKDIADGKLKEGKCLVECVQEEPIPMTYKGVDSRGDYIYYCPKCGWGGSYMGIGQVHCYMDECRPTTIKLNPHITIYPVEEKMHTREEVIKLAFDFYFDMSVKMNVPTNLISENRDNAKLWLEQSGL